MEQKNNQIRILSTKKAANAAYTYVDYLLPIGNIVRPYSLFTT